MTNRIESVCVIATCGLKMQYVIRSKQNVEFVNKSRQIKFLSDLFDNTKLNICAITVITTTMDLL
jgi:hypothetical protein